MVNMQNHSFRENIFVKLFFVYLLVIKYFFLNYITICFSIYVLNYSGCHLGKHEWRVVSPFLLTFSNIFVNKTCRKLLYLSLIYTLFFLELIYFKSYTKTTKNACVTVRHWPLLFYFYVGFQAAVTLKIFIL